MQENFKSGFVTLIGRPNVGKSTLMNRLIGQKIAITSNKPQTTRNRIQTVLTTEEGQIVFVDTPGIHKAKNKLGEYMVNIAERSLNEVDVVLWLVEPSTFIGAGEKHIIEQLKKVKTPVILVINKVDMVKKEEVLTFIDAYRKECDFAEIVPVSARRGDNTDELVNVIMKYLPYGPQFYDEDTITDQPERQIVAEIIREKALHSLNEEIPHGIAVAIDQMKMNHKVDYIITHTAPYEVLAEMGMDISDEEETFSLYLDHIRKIVDFKDWYFGHLHFDEELDNFHCIFENVVELKDN